MFLVRRRWWRLRPSRRPMSEVRYACVYSLPSPSSSPHLLSLARDFSPRFACPRDDLVLIDISGLGRLLGHARAIGGELHKSAIARGLRAQIAVAPTQTAAMVLALTRPGVIVVRPGGEAAALAGIPISVLTELTFQPSPEAEPSTLRETTSSGSTRAASRVESLRSIVAVLQAWGIKTLGEFAALPAADVSARIGQQGLIWQRLARGEDVGPLVPQLAEERFESSIELEWPIEGHEPLSFVLTRLLEPLSTRLERRDRGAVAIHVVLGLVTRNTFARSVQLPSPIRDVRTLRTLIMLDLESHPPPSGIERVSVRIEATPGRVWQHTLFSRAQPEPEQLSTLVARLHALMGQDRIGRPALVDSYRPGAFEMLPFASGLRNADSNVSNQLDGQFVSALRRCRRAVPARVTLADGRPVHVTTDRRGFAGGRVLASAGPWQTSGEWWDTRPDRAGGAGGVGGAGRYGVQQPSPERESLRSSARTSEVAWLASGGGAPRAVKEDERWWGPTRSKQWDCDEWDVSLSDGAVYRIFRDRGTGSWFVDAIVD